jgi:hypothetical protein
MSAHQRLSQIIKSVRRNTGPAESRMRDCHEHLEYYSSSLLEALLNRHDLEVFDAELNDVNGGSFRVYVKHRACKSLGTQSNSRIGLRNYTNWKLKCVSRIDESIWSSLPGSHSWSEGSPVLRRRVPQGQEGLRPRCLNEGKHAPAVLEA